MAAASLASAKLMLPSELPPTALADGAKMRSALERIEAHDKMRWAKGAVRSEAELFAKFSPIPPLPPHRSPPRQRERKPQMLPPPAGTPAGAAAPAQVPWAAAAPMLAATYPEAAVPDTSTTVGFEPVRPVLAPVVSGATALQHHILNEPGGFGDHRDVGHAPQGGTSGICTSRHTEASQLAQHASPGPTHPNSRMGIPWASSERAPTPDGARSRLGCAPNPGVPHAVLTFGEAEKDELFTLYELRETAAGLSAEQQRRFAHLRELKARSAAAASVLTGNSIPLVNGPACQSSACPNEPRPAMGDRTFAHYQNDADAMTPHGCTGHGWQSGSSGSFAQGGCVPGSPCGVPGNMAPASCGAYGSGGATPPCNGGFDRHRCSYQVDDRMGSAHGGCGGYNAPASGFSGSGGGPDSYFNDARPSWQCNDGGASWIDAPPLAMPAAPAAGRVLCSPPDSCGVADVGSGVQHGVRPGTDTFRSRGGGCGTSAGTSNGVIGISGSREAERRAVEMYDNDRCCFYVACPLPPPRAPSVECMDALPHLEGLTGPTMIPLSPGGALRYAWSTHLLAQLKAVFGYSKFRPPQVRASVPRLTVRLRCTTPCGGPPRPLSLDPISLGAANFPGISVLANKALPCVPPSRGRSTTPARTQPSV